MFEPSTSVAVTVIVAAPPDSGVTSNIDPDTDTVATASSDDEAAKVRSSPSGSRNAPDTSTVLAPSATRSDVAGRLPTASGERFCATVTRNVCVALVFEPLASVAATVTVASPRDCGVTVTREPDTVTVVTDSFDDEAP